MYCRTVYLYRKEQSIAIDSYPCIHTCIYIHIHNQSLYLVQILESQSSIVALVSILGH
jgi:hypothetical protein